MCLHRNLIKWIWDLVKEACLFSKWLPGTSLYLPRHLLDASRPFENRQTSLAKTKLIFLLSGLLSFSSTALALPTDENQPVHIEAASTLFNYKTGANSYEGNVKIDQGTTHILADKVTTQRGTNHKFNEAFAYGIKQLAEYITIPKEGDEIFHAKAKVIKFYPPKSLVICEGDAFVTQGQNSFHGPIIIYNTKTQIVDAPASKEGRSTIIIQPDNLPKS